MITQSNCLTIFEIAQRVPFNAKKAAIWHAGTPHQLPSSIEILLLVGRSPLRSIFTQINVFPLPELV